MARLLPVPSPGHIARVRQRLYLVEDIVAPPIAGESTLVRLSCIDDDNQGQPLEVLWERELDPAILMGEAWASIASEGSTSRSYSLRTCYVRWNCVTATDPRLFRRRFALASAWMPISLNPCESAHVPTRQSLHRG